MLHVKVYINIIYILDCFFYIPLLWGNFPTVFLPLKGIIGEYNQPIYQIRNKQNRMTDRQPDNYVVKGQSVSLSIIIRLLSFDKPIKINKKH